MKYASMFLALLALGSCGGGGGGGESSTPQITPATGPASHSLAGSWSVSGQVQPNGPCDLTTGLESFVLDLQYFDTGEPGIDGYLGSSGIISAGVIGGQTIKLPNMEPIFALTGSFYLPGSNRTVSLSFEPFLQVGQCTETSFLCELDIDVYEGNVLVDLGDGPDVPFGLPPSCSGTLTLSGTRTAGLASASSGSFEGGWMTLFGPRSLSAQIDEESSLEIETTAGRRARAQVSLEGEFRIDSFDPATGVRFEGSGRLEGDERLVGELLVFDPSLPIPVSGPFDLARR